MVTTVVRHCAGLMNRSLSIVNCARKDNGPFLELLVSRGKPGETNDVATTFLSEEFATKKAAEKFLGRASPDRDGSLTASAKFLISARFWTFWNSPVHVFSLSSMIYY